VKFLRYQSQSISPHTGKPYGPFIAVWHLIRDEKVTMEEEAAYWEHRRWFEAHLPIPPYHNQGNPQRAVTWFKHAALTPLMLEKLSFYLNLGAKYGIEFQIATAEHLSGIIYEDEYQVAVAASS
jgi:hypothetical protein